MIDENIRRVCRESDYGADMVVAHRTHCIQRYKRFRDKYIFYGLGNLVFDLEHPRRFEDTDESVLVVMSFSDREITFQPYSFPKRMEEQGRFRLEKITPCGELPRNGCARSLWLASALHRRRRHAPSSHNTLSEKR